MESEILVVDDDPSITEIIQIILSEKFNNIKISHNIDEAILITKKKKYSLIILDIKLEDRNGAELIKYIIEDEDHINKATPIFIISGMINQKFIDKNKDRFAGIIPKPFDHKELLNSVDLYLNKKIKTESLPEKIFPKIECILPFSIPQLQTKVEIALDQINKNSKLKELFKNLKFHSDPENYLNAHIGMLINISTALSIELEWNSEKTLEKFIYAAYLHDMALVDRPDLAKILTGQQLLSLKDTLSKHDYQLAHDHSNIAADKIQLIHEIPSDVAQIVRQHHESPKETGFPMKIGSMKISPLSTVFIVAHDFTDYVISDSDWSIDKFLNSYKSKYKGPHFSKVFFALESLQKKHK